MAKQHCGLDHHRFTYSYPSFLSVNELLAQLGYPERIFLLDPYSDWMGFILNYQSRGFIFALDSITSKQATICLGEPLNKYIILELVDPSRSIDISSQEGLFGDFAWETQADPGYSPKEIMDRM